MTYPSVPLGYPDTGMLSVNAETRPDIVPPNPPAPLTKKVRLTLFGLSGFAAAMLVTNAVLLTTLMVGSDNQDTVSEVDKACIGVLSNGGVPDDCSRMYNLDFFP